MRTVCVIRWARTVIRLGQIPETGLTGSTSLATVRLMRTFTAAAATAALILLAGGTAASAAPATRPGGDQAAGRLIRQHDCHLGAEYGNGINGWLRDDVTTPRRELVYVDIDHATNGTWRWRVLYSCRR